MTTGNRTEGNQEPRLKRNKTEGKQDRKDAKRIYNQKKPI